MQINSLLENITTSSSPANTTSSAPKFGRSDKVLEDDKVEESSCGTSVAGGFASVPSSVGDMQRRGKGSMFTGIKTSRKFPNSSTVKEDSEEYDDEAGMVDNNLETMKRAVQGIDDVVSAGDNLPEWCQEKIAVSKSMLVTVWDYMRSEEERGEEQGVAEGGDVPHWRVEQSKATGRYYVVTGYTDKSRRVWKSKQGAGDFNKKENAEAKAQELNQGVAEGLDPYRLERLDPQTRRVLIRMAKHAEPGSWLSAAESYAMQLGLEHKSEDPRGWEQEVQYFVDLYRQYSGQGVAEDTRKRLSNKHDKIRKQAGLPDPKEYEKLIQQKKKEIADLKSQQNNKMNEAEISEEQLLAKELKKQLDMFKKAPNKDISNKAPSKEIGAKPKDKDIINKVLDEKSVSKAQFRTMAAVAHNPKFAKKVGIKPSVGKEFHKADKKQSYKELPDRADEDSKGLWANIHAKRERIKHGSGERMRKPGSKGAPTQDALRKSAK